jgi:DNA-binding PadR family transcriptional regulator
MLGELELIVMLAALRLGKDSYGVSIQQAVLKATGRDLTLGTIHKTLVRLEAKGMLRSRIGEPTPVRGGRRKRCFDLTAAGRRALRSSLSVLHRMAAGLAPGLEPT